MHYQDHYLWASPLLGLDACLNRLHLSTWDMDENVGQKLPMLMLDSSCHRALATVNIRSICMPVASVIR